MIKLISFFNTRKHYRQRLKQRKGNHWLFLKAKKVLRRHCADKSLIFPCYEWRYKNFVWITQGFQLQTFIDKNIRTGKWKRRYERML